MADKGWIALNRSIQDHWIWSKERPFDQRSAWIDLLLQANHKVNRFPLGTEMVEVERGSFITSERKLGDRWGWSNTKVRNFLKLLENDNMITKITDSKKSTITIVNYSTYQDLKSTETAERQQTNSTGTAEEHTNNNDITMNNNENNNKVVDLVDKKANNDYQKIVDMYNEICISYPRLKKLSESRKKAIKARLNSYSMDDFKEMFEAAERSDFLKGKNDRNWSATFDWLLKDSNMTKVLEGNYNNKGEGKQQGQQPKKEGEIDFYDVRFYEQFKNKSN